MAKEISEVVYIYIMVEIMTTMKTVKKFTTFEDLKSYESKTTKNIVSLKKHKVFKKIIMEIKSLITINKK